MRFPVPLFGMFLIFLFWMTYELHKSKATEAKEKEKFWNNEHEANFTRKQSLDQLNFIPFTAELLPTPTEKQLASNPELRGLHEQALALCDKKIVNLNGMTNTEVKRTYGAANLPVLTEYDDNFATMCRLLNELSAIYYKTGCITEVTQLLEFAIQNGSDVFASYTTLGNIYISAHTPEKLDELIASAEKLNSIMKPSILSQLLALKTNGSIS